MGSAFGQLSTPLPGRSRARAPPAPGARRVYALVRDIYTARRVSLFRLLYELMREIGGDGGGPGAAVRL